MAHRPRQLQQFSAKSPRLANLSQWTYEGDCEADPVPALWSQDDDEVVADSFLEKYWLPIAVGVLAGWAGITFFLVAAFGWLVILAVAGVVVAGSATAVVLVRSGGNEMPEVQATTPAEADDFSYRNAA